MILQLEINSFFPAFFGGPRTQMHISVWFQIIWGSWVGFPCEDKVPFKSQRYKKFNLPKNQFHIFKRRPSILIPIPTGAIFITSHQSVTEGGGLFASRRLYRNLSYDACQHEIWFGGLISRLWELANFKCGRCVIAAFLIETRTAFTCNAVLFCVSLMVSVHPNSIEHLLGARAPSPLPLWPVRDGWLVSLPGSRPGVEQLGKTVVGGWQRWGWGWARQEL